MNSENPYKQSWLSAYFGILPRSRKDDKGHQARKAWLDTIRYTIMTVRI